MAALLLAPALTAVLAACGTRAGAGTADPGPTAPATTAPPPPTTPPPTSPPPTTPPPTTPPPTTQPPPPTTAAATTTPTAGPPYPVSEATFALVDGSRPTVSGGRTVSPTRALTTLVWAPRVAAGTGRLPLVVFAHGFQVGPQPYETLLRAWAADGWVVAAPEFPLTDGAVAGPNLDENDMQNQPQDVRFVTDWLVSAADPLAPSIDPSRVVVAGHSDGGETALSAAITPAPAGEPAYRAVIAMSVQPVTTGPSPNPPILVSQGTADTINPPDLGTQTFDLAAAPKYMLLLAGGDHLGPVEAGSAWLPGIEAVTEAFLAAYGAGAAPAASIAAAAARYPLLSLRSA